MSTTPTPREPAQARLAVRFFDSLMRLYPPDFRAAYSQEMCLLFRDLIRRRAKGRGLVRLTLYAFADVLRTSLYERMETMGKRGWGAGAAILLGIGITWVDSRPGWDDTGITAGVIFLTCAAMGCASPRSPWLWALCVSAWIPLYGILHFHNGTTVLAMLPAVLGAYLGAAVRTLIFPPTSHA